MAVTADKLRTLNAPAWIAQSIGLLKGENRKEQLREMISSLAIPVTAFLLFLVLWGASAAQIETSLGTVPGPAKVWEQAVTLYDEHVAARDKEDAFYERQEKRNAKKLAKDPNAEVKIRPYTGAPTFFDQILTSIITVATGLWMPRFLSSF